MVKAIKRVRKPSVRRGAVGRTILDYAQQALAEMHVEVQRRGALRGDCSPVREQFWRAIEPKVYEPDEGRSHLDAYLEFLEKHLAKEISKRSVIYFEHIYRRIAPKSGGRNDEAATIMHMRGHFEAAIQKYGRLEACEKIAKASEVSPDKVLKGYLLANRQGERALAALRSEGHFVLTDFDVVDLIELYELERVAYEVWRSMAVRRALGKGAPLVVLPSGFADGRSDDLDFLLTSYDARRSAWIASATGVVFAKTTADARRARRIALPEYNVEGTPLSEMRPVLEAFGHAFDNDEEMVPNFAWRPVDISAFIAAHRPFFSAFEEKHGVSCGAVILLAASAALVQKLGWKDAFTVVRSIQRAGFGPASRDDILASAGNVAEALCKGWAIDTPSQEDLGRAFDFWTLGPDREHINVQNGGPHALFLPYGADRWFVDCAWVSRRLHHLFFGLEMKDQTFKGDPLERYVRGSDASPLPSAPCRARSGESKQVDASFEQGDSLVIAECRAVNWSFAFERGDPEAVAFRERKQNKALADAEDKARWLKQNPVGTNYDVSRFRRIVSIGVSAFPEFVPSRDKKFWLTERVPRFPTPDELRSALAAGVFSHLPDDHPAVVQLR